MSEEEFQESARLATEQVLQEKAWQFIRTVFWGVTAMMGLFFIATAINIGSIFVLPIGLLVGGAIIVYSIWEILRINRVTKIISHIRG